MKLARVLVVAALLSATTGPIQFARASGASQRQPRHEQILPRFDRAAGAGHSWCLHDYADDAINCAYSSRSECAATASGGLGQCSVN
jgi:Protein of unknown function (DUF3551)